MPRVVPFEPPIMQGSNTPGLVFKRYLYGQMSSAPEARQHR